MKVLKRVIAQESTITPGLPTPSPKPAVSGVGSNVSSNGRMRLFNVTGNTFSIKEKLAGLGFRFFKGAWGKPVETIGAQERANLQALGIDVSPLGAEPVLSPSGVDRVAASANNWYGRSLLACDTLDYDDANAEDKRVMDTGLSVEEIKKMKKKR